MNADPGIRGEGEIGKETIVGPDIEEGGRTLLEPEFQNLEGGIFEARALPPGGKLREIAEIEIGLDFGKEFRVDRFWAQAAKQTEGEGAEFRHLIAEGAPQVVEHGLGLS